MVYDKKIGKPKCNLNDIVRLERNCEIGKKIFSSVMITIKRMN